MSINSMKNQDHAEREYTRRWRKKWFKDRKVTEIDGDLVLDKNETYDGDLFVYGNIYGDHKYSLRVNNGHLAADNIYVSDLIVPNGNIAAEDISANTIKTKRLYSDGDIKAQRIDANEIIAEKTIDAKDISTYKIYVDKNRQKLKA
ncbi:MAG: hypothetical protein QXS81_01115 [Candidatus Micrarchaeaceae archaeon]